jgi:hypothetical protein
MHSKAGARAASVLLILALAAFGLLMLLAARAYPGGTYCEPAATSYRFWGNYFCDLTGKVTGRGDDNSRSAAFMEAAFGSFALAIAPFFWLLADLSGRRSVRLVGLVSAVATVAIAWLPSRAGPTLHAVAVFSATLPGLAAAGLGVEGLLRRRKRARRVRGVALLGIATFAAGLADAAGYAHAVATHGGCIPWLPALQKLVALSLVAWMLAVALVGARAHDERSA